MAETDEENMYDMLEDFEDMGMDPRKHSSRDGPQGRRDPHHSDDMGSFDQDDFGSRRPMTRGGLQGGRDMGRHHLYEIGGFDQEKSGSRGPLTRSGRQGCLNPMKGVMIGCELCCTASRISFFSTHGPLNLRVFSNDSSIINKSPRGHLAQKRLRVR